MVKDEVLRELELNRGARISGSKLAQKLGVSRAAVWKAIKALREEGLEISATPGGGYHLAAQDDSLTPAGIQSILQTRAFGHELVVLSETDSTNTTMKQEYASTHEEGFTLISEKQNAGRGRLGRTFVSPPEGGLYMSILLRPKLSLDRLNFITIAAAVAVCRAIEETCEFRPEIKWVNDVLMDGKKLCGILTEASIEGETGAIDYVVLGVGINLHLDRTVLPAEVNAVAGALGDYTDNPPRRAELAASVLQQMEEVYAELLSGELQSLLQTYRGYLCCIEKQVRVFSPAGNYEAVCKDINEQGNLIVETEEGKRLVLSSGEISIRLPV